MAPFCYIVRFAHYPFLKEGGKRGGLGGEGSFAAGSPPGVDSEKGFMAEGPLEGPGAT